MAQNTVVSRSLPIPDAYAGAVIGRQGCSIERIRRVSGCELCFFDTNNPKTDYRGRSWHHLRLKGTPSQLYKATEMAIAAICFTGVEDDGEPDG